MRKTRDILIPAIILLLLVPFSGGAEKYRLLCLGNSFSRDAVTKYLYPLIASDGEDILIANFYQVAASMNYALSAVKGDTVYKELDVIRDGKKKVYTHFSLPEVMTSEQWDYVSIQEYSEITGCPIAYRVIPELTREIRKITGEEQKILFHQTWAYADWFTGKAFSRYGYDTDSMYYAIMKSTSALAEEYPQIDDVVPSGTAIQNGRLNTNTFKKLSRDGIHLDSLGCFIASCTWYEKLTGRDCRLNRYKPNIINDEAAELAKECAHNAVTSPFRPSRLIHNNLGGMRPKPFDIYTSVGLLVFRTISDRGHRLTVLTPAGMKVFESDVTTRQDVRLQSGVYLILVDGEYVRSVLL